MNQKYFKKGEFISVYTDTDDQFALGCVLTADKTHIVLQTLTPSAEQEGLTLYRLEDIVKIERNTLYQNKLIQQFENRQIPLAKYEPPQRDLMQWLFQQAQAQNKIVQVQLQLSGHCDVQGYVALWDNAVCTIQQVDDYGRADGEVMFLWSDITSIKVMDREK